MANSTHYYAADGQPVNLEPSTDTLVIAYKNAVPEKDLEKLVRGDDQLAKLIASPELSKRQLVIYKRSPAASGSLADLAQRIEQSDLIAYTQTVYYRGESLLVVTDEFIVQFKPETTEAEIAALHETNGVEVMQPIDFVANTFLLRHLHPEQENTLQVVNRYYESGLAVYAEPNFIYVAQLRFAPNDPLYPQQWHLPRIQAEDAWDITQGSQTVVIAVVDDGVDLDHEDFSSTAKFVPGINLVGGNNDPRPGQPDDNHGTAVAGVIAADGNNNLGVSGIAPNCRLMAIRLLGSGQTLLMEANAFRFAADNGAAIISNSWGPTDRGGPAPLPGIVQAAIDYAADNGRDGLGCVILFAAGNGNEHISSAATLDGYASYHRVIAVAAVNNRNVRSGYSDFGPEINICTPSDGTSANPPLWQAVLGPAFEEDTSTLAIVTTDRMGQAGYNPPDQGASPAVADINYTGGFGGTSSACPLAAGVAALMLAIAPDLTERQVRYILEATADKVDPANTHPLGHYQPDGHSQWYGYGRVNAPQAVRGARSSVPHRDEIERVTITLRRTTGDRFVSEPILQAIDARRRRANEAAQIFIRSGPDGYLRAELGELLAQVDVDE
jgi:subtilisin family serine protease